MVRILVVEDHADSLRAMAHLLRRMQYEVDVADSCAAARRVAAGSAGGHAVVVADVQLPDGDGADLLAELGRRTGCGTIAVTARDGPSDLARYDRLGLDRWLIKPLHAEFLSAAIDGLLMECSPSA